MRYGVILLLLLAASTAAPEAIAAQTVSGRLLIVEADRTRVGQGVSVRLTCGGSQVSDSTNDDGFYRIRAPSAGDCTLSVRRGESWSTTVSVRVPRQGMTANLELKRFGERWVLRRI